MFKRAYFYVLLSFESQAYLLSFSIVRQARIQARNTFLKQINQARLRLNFR